MKKTETPTVEKQVAEFNYQLAITNRLTELNAIKETIQRELNDAQQYMQQKSAELNATLGAIAEFEKLITIPNSINH